MLVVGLQLLITVHWYFPIKFLFGLLVECDQLEQVHLIVSPRLKHVLCLVFVILVIVNVGRIL